MAGSLRWRLLMLTVLGLSVALTLAGVVLAGIFRDHVQRQFEVSLQAQLDQLTARLEFDAAGQPQIAADRLSDPRWQRPYAGLYWQIDEMSRDGQSRKGVLRSRSLWDASLNLQADALRDGAVHVHAATGPERQSLLLLERTVMPEGQALARWRLIVAGDLSETDAAVAGFNRVLAMSLLVMLALMALVAWAQVSVGLRPLRALQQALQGLREGHSTRLEGGFISEVQPLVDDFNAVLDRHREVVARARTQAGNLAHALKTPLAVMEQAATADVGTCPGLAGVVHEQCQMARRHVDWHLRRARMAASQGLPGVHTPIAPVIQGLVRVMQKVHAGRGIAIHVDAQADASSPPLLFRGEEQDLHEILGNLLDNACKWARHDVHVAAQPWRPGTGLRVIVEDDGPGIDPAGRQMAMARGVRLDESAPGSGLGLAIVGELVALYGGSLSLEAAASGGLRAVVVLPAVQGPLPASTTP
ncbi:MAG: ATP-binding protein [Aquabacterium sp.]